MLEEAQAGLASGQTSAVCALCSAIVEVTVRDICVRRELLPKGQSRLSDLEEIPFATLCRKVASGRRLGHLVDIHREATALLHGKKLMDSDGAQWLFDETLRLVQDLYRANDL
jgi:hypothetical protein